ncbi:MAG: hypothetical protein R3C05_25620 [Pirellulaceae bacterium]
MPDHSEGKKAKCPHCSTIVTIPSAPALGTAPIADPFASPPQPLGSTGGSDFDDPTSRQPQSAPQSAMPHNPYASPTTTDRYDAATPQSPLHVQPIDVGTALTAAWELFKLNTGLLVGAYLIQLVLSVAISLGLGVVQVAMTAILEDPQHPAIVIVNVVGSIGNQIIQFWIAIGVIILNLSVARGQRATIGMLFSGGPYLLRYIGGAFLFGIGILVGLVLLIIPAIYFALTYWSYMYFLVDRNCGVFESFRLASVHASGNRGNVFVMGLLGSALSLAGVLACGVGILIAAPVILLMFVICYLMMTGQRFVQVGV